VTYGRRESLSKYIYVFIIFIKPAKIMFGKLYVSLIRKELRRVSQILKKEKEITNTSFAALISSNI
jgi:hypothetical protein